MHTHVFSVQLRSLSKLFAGTAAVLGAGAVIARLYLLGGAADLRFPHVVTGVSFALCGSAIYLQQDERAGDPVPLASSCAAAAFSIALLTVAYYLLLGPPVAGMRAIVMPPNTAAALLLLSAATLLGRAAGAARLASQLLAGAGLALAVLTIIAHAPGVQLFARTHENTPASMPMSVGAALVLSLLALSLLLAPQDAAAAPAGRGLAAARRLFLPAIALPFLAAWLAFRWRQGDAFGDGVGLALAAVGAVVLLSAFIWSQALALDGYARARLHERPELARLEEHMRLLLQATRDHAVFRLDPAGRVVSWNDGARHILGHPATAILGTPFERLFAPGDAGLPAQLLEDARAHGQAAREHQYARAGGATGCAYSTISAQYETGRLGGFVVVMQDISEGKRAAEERALLTSMLATMIDSVIVIDDRGIIETVNPATERAFGYRADELVGNNVSMLMPSPHREQHDAYLARYLRTGERHVLGYVRELAAQRKDGTQFPMELMVSEMTVADRRRFTGVVRDISERKRAEEMLAQYDQRFRAVYDNAAVGIAVLSPEQRFLYVNRKLAEIAGYSAEELSSRSMESLAEPEDAAVGREQYRRLLADAVGSILIEMRWHRRDGATIWIDASISCVRDKDGAPAYAIAVIEDISTRKAAAEELKKSKQDLDVALEGTHVHLWHLDCETGRLSYLDKLPQALGYRQDEVRSELDFWMSLFHPDDRMRIVERMRDADPAAGADEAEIRMHASDGSWKWMLVRARILERSARGKPLRVAGTCLDITGRKETEQEMLHLAQHDTLTGLPNRALSYAFGERTLASARRDGLQSAVLFIDLDRFKPINDTYGHDAGDAVLREVARRLRGCVRAEDMVGRLGGDEFLMVLADVDGPRGAGRVASQCIAALAQPCLYKELRLQVSSSIGIAMFPSDGGDIFTLSRNADVAMYHAKECGRENFQFFTEELNARAASAVVMENRLRAGLRQNEFQLYYQPIVELASGNVIGAEALLRWPDAGVAPEQFIPVAEYTGLIHPLGEWTLNEACRQQRAWQACGLDSLTMSVNVSPAQFRQPGFRSAVARAVVESGIDPKFLQLEITENVLVKNSDTVVETLHALKQLGVHVVLDDFGKGYSSLAYLKRLPVDAIKIDKDFIHDLNADRGNMAITAAIINLGMELGLQVIAEGIESEATLHSLQARHCKAIQGFYVCRPVAGGEFEEWYRSRNGLVVA